MFLRAVKLYNSGDFRSSTEDMERALAEYLAVFARCLAGCEGAHEQVDFKDFYPAIAGSPHRVPSTHPIPHACYFHPLQSLPWAQEAASHSPTLAQTDRQTDSVRGAGPAYS